YADLITERGDVWLGREDCGQLVHDLKTPFNGVVGLTEAMKVMVRDEGKKRLLSMINRAGTRLAEYVERTLEIDELSRGTMFMQQQDVDVGLSILEAVELMRYAEDKNGVPVRKSTVELVHDCPAEWSEGEGPVVEGDDMKISRVMYHIIDNALRYTESGTVTVSGKTDADFVTVTVSDTGIGIDPARHDEIFIPFRRLAYPHDGCLGLGLSVVLETLHLMSGSIAVHSLGRGQGTTVTVRIPIKMNSPVPLQTFDRGPEGFGLYLDTTQPRPSQRLLMKRTVGLLAHELRIPFLGVIGCSDYLVRTEEKKPLQKQLGMINRCGVRLVDVIDVVRDAALMLELPAGLVVKSVQIPMLVENIHKQLDVAKDKRNQPMKKREVNFFNECPASLPDIQGEELKLAKIIEHVAENALKFTNKGHVRIDAKATKGMVTLIVEDTGIGIPDEDQERVFQPFVRLEPHNYYGLGLGLTVVYEIVKLAGGSIEIESAKDKGTTFRIRLPTESPKTVYLDHLDAVFVEASKRPAADDTSADGRPRESPADHRSPIAAAASPPATTPGESSSQAPPRSNSRSVGFLDVPEQYVESSREDSTTGLEAEALNAPPAASEEEGQTQEPLGSYEVERLQSELGRQQQANTETAAALQDWQQRCEALVKDNLQLRREMVEERERSAGEIRELSSELGSVKKESQELQDTIGRQEKNVKRLEEERAAAVAGAEKANRQFAAEKKLREKDRGKASTHPAHTAEMSKLQSRLEVANEELVACRRELKESREEVETLKGSDPTEVNGLVTRLQARLGRANETIEELREEIDESARKRAALSRELSRLRNGRSEDAIVKQKGSDSHAFLHAVEQLKDVASFMQQEIEQHVSRRGVETSEALRCLREENEKLRTELRMVRASGDESQHPKYCQEGGDFEELKRQNEHLRAELGHRSARILRLQQEARRLRSHIAELSLGLQEKEDEAEDHSLRLIARRPCSASPALRRWRYPCEAQELLDYHRVMADRHGDDPSTALPALLPSSSVSTTAPTTARSRWSPTAASNQAWTAPTQPRPFNGRPHHHPRSPLLRRLYGSGKNESSP
ncbi:hypothetical protein FOZ62_010218, partial [Perkinsus olseni]